MAERVTVNHYVVGSSPTFPAKKHLIKEEYKMTLRERERILASSVVSIK